MDLSAAYFEEARKQFFADTGDDVGADETRVQDQGDADWDQGGGGRDLTFGALGLLAITVVMSLF